MRMIRTWAMCEHFIHVVHRIIKMNCQFFFVVLLQNTIHLKLWWNSKISTTNIIIGTITYLCADILKFYEDKHRCVYQWHDFFFLFFLVFSQLHPRFLWVQQSDKLFFFIFHPIFMKENHKKKYIPSHLFSTQSFLFVRLFVRACK